MAWTPPPPSGWTVASGGAFAIGDMIRDQSERRKRDERIAMLDERQQTWRAEDIARREAELAEERRLADEREANRLLTSGATPATMGEARPNGLAPTPQVVSGAGDYIRPNRSLANVGGRYFDVSGITPQAQEERRLARADVERIQGIEDQKELARFTASLRPPPAPQLRTVETDQGIFTFNDRTGELTPAIGPSGEPLRPRLSGPKPPPTFEEYARSRMSDFTNPANQYGQKVPGIQPDSAMVTIAQEYEAIHGPSEQTRRYTQRSTPAPETRVAQESGPSLVERLATRTKNLFGGHAQQPAEQPSGTLDPRMSKWAEIANDPDLTGEQKQALHRRLFPEQYR